MTECWCSLFSWVVPALAIFAAISLLTFLVPQILEFFYCEQNLKKKYNATWAVVTGASSGIGRALTEKLAKQDINVVMVALDDNLFTQTYEEFCKKYTSVQFRKVPVNLGKPGYMEPIRKACSDINPNLIFNNAGYIATGLFADTTLEQQMANYECNATAPVQITHFFLNQMLNAGQKGAVFFTSSPSGLIPNPMASMYGSTKAFLTEFAASIAAEVKSDGIDVAAVMPSPVNTGFYAGNKHNLSSMDCFRKTGTSPEIIANCFFRCAGRSVIFDQGYFPFWSRLLLKLLDFNLFSFITASTSHTLEDFKKAKKKRNVKSN